MTKKVRWKQRFDNFQNAFLALDEAVSKNALSNLERAGLIKHFEFTFELTWKTLKDFLESEGIIAVSPRETLKHAFRSGYIENGEDWISALDNRNLLAHTYNEELSKKAESLIREIYYPLLKNFSNNFTKKLSK